MRLRHISDVNVCGIKHVSYLPEHFGASEEIEFLINADVDGIDTRVIERGEMLREIVYLCIMIDEQDTHIFKKGSLCDDSFG